MLEKNEILDTSVTLGTTEVATIKQSRGYLFSQ